MKNCIFILTLFLTFIHAYEIPQTSLDLKEEKVQSDFFYLSGGVSGFLPTVSVGYRTLYGSFASDFSVSQSILYIWGMALEVPSLNYEQLAYLKSYKDRTNRSLPFLGLKVGYSGYPYIETVTGLHFREENDSFLEFGVRLKNHYSKMYGLSISYAITF